MRHLRYAEPLQHRCAPLQAAPLVQRRQVLILHLQRWPKCGSKKNKSSCVPTHHLLRWPVLRLHEPLDAAVGAPRQTVQHGTTAIQALINDAARTRS